MSALAALAALDRLDARFRAPAPAERLAVVRILVGAFGLVYLLVRAGYLTRYGDYRPEQFVPVGVVSVLSAPLPPALVVALFVAAAVATAAFTVGFRFRVAGPACAALLLWVLTYRNSWGMVFHTENLLVLHAIVLGLVPAADALSLDARGRDPAPESGRYGWPLVLISAITAAAYLLAGIAKLRIGGVEWAVGDALRNQIAYDNLRKLMLGSGFSRTGGALVAHGWVFPPLAVMSLLIELGAPLALLHRRVALVWAAAAWGFHVGVVVLMAIVFPYQLTGVAYASFFPLERLVARLGRPAARSAAAG